MTQKARSHLRVRRGIIVLGAVALLWSSFGPLCWLDRTLGFRDAANYYYPLFQWQCTQWRQGRVPLWNPLDSTGSPTFADTTSSVLYPGKLLFALPLSFRLRYLVYIVAHVALAAISTSWVARRWGASLEAAALGGLAYGFAGAVLFQVHNVVFLVGAAWLPLAVFASERMFVTQSREAAIGLGAALALMTLGGDPQMAYNTVLLAALYALLNIRSPALPRRCFARTKLLVTAVCAGLLLSSVQVLPAVQRTGHSERALYDQPRNVYELAAETSREPATFTKHLQGLFSPPRPATHHARSLDFSLAPWQLAELIWPNCSGHFFPTNRRWVSRFPTSCRVWTPSLYLGLLPVLLAFGIRKGTPRCTRSQWLLAAALLGLIASLGRYGVGWGLQQVRASMWENAAEGPWMGDSVGGLYWCMATFLPGYSLFRYPAKLAVIPALMITLLAATRADSVFGGDARRLRKQLIVVLAASATMLVGFWLARAPWTQWLAGATADPLFGPLDAAGAARQVRGSLFHTSVVALLSLLILWLPRGAISKGSLLFLLTAADIGVANVSLISSVDGRLLRQPAAVLSAVNATERRQWRVVRRDVRPPVSWSRTSDRDRLGDVVSWERSSLFGKYHLGEDASLLDAAGTFRSGDFRAVLRLGQALDQQATVHRWFSAKYRLEPRVGTLPNESPFVLKEDPRSLPRAWLVEEVIRVPAVNPIHRQPLDEVTEKALAVRGRLRDLRKQAVVEDDFSTSPPAFDLATTASCQLVSAQPHRLVLSAKNSRTALLVVNDLYYPGWRAWVATDQAEAREFPIVRTNRVMRGIFLPPGNHRIEMRFVPLTFYCGAVLSGLAWSLLLVVTVRRRRGWQQ